MILELAQAATTDFPWDKVGAGGAALLVAGLLVYTLRQSREQHKECNATIEKVTGEFSKTVKESADRYAVTTEAILRDARESHERREDKLYETLREVRGKAS